MQLIKPSVEFLGEVPADSLDEQLKFIEKIGRLCYKSEDKIGPGTAEKFVKGTLVKREHLAMVEHSNFVVRAFGHPGPISLHHGTFLQSAYADDTLYIGGNLTAWYYYCKSLGFIRGFAFPFADKYKDLFDLPTARENLVYPWEVCPDSEIPDSLKRFSFKFICDRGVSHELVRHRPCSFAQESTRYCDYKDQPIEFVKPWWWDEEGPGSTAFVRAMMHSESEYKILRQQGYSPQAARAVLPNAVKTEIVVTADREEWDHIFKLRCAKGAHPDMQIVANEAYDLFPVI